MHLPALSVAAPAWHVPGPQEGCVQPEEPPQEADVWLMGLCPSSTAGSGLCGLGQGSREEKWRTIGGPGGWSLLCQQPEAFEAGGSLAPWPL